MPDLSSFAQDPSSASSAAQSSDSLDSWLSNFDFMWVLYLVLGLMALWVLVRLGCWLFRHIKRQGEVNALQKDLMVRQVLTKLSKGGADSDSAKSELNLKLSLIDLYFKQGQELIEQQRHLGKNKAWFIMLGEPRCGKTTLLENADVGLINSSDPFNVCGSRQGTAISIPTAASTASAVSPVAASIASTAASVTTSAVNVLPSAAAVGNNATANAAALTTGAAGAVEVAQATGAAPTAAESPAVFMDQGLSTYSAAQGNPPDLADQASPAVQFYVGHNHVILDVSGEVFFDHWAGGSSAEYAYICKQINKKHKSEPLRGILLCLPADALLADDSKLTQKKALLMFEELWRLTATLNQYLPCYIMITKLDVVLGFREYFASLDSELKDQAFGFINPHGETFTAAVVEQFFAQMQSRLIEGAYSLFSSKEVFDLTYQGKSRLDKSAGIYLFAQNFAKLQNNLLLYLNTIFSPQSKNYAFFRGLFFTAAADLGYCLDSNFAYLAHKSIDEAVFADPNYQYSRAFFIKGALENQVFADEPSNHFNHRAQLRRDIPRYVTVAACGLLSVYFLYGAFGVAPHLKQVLANDVLYYSALEPLFRTHVIEHAPLLGTNRAGMGFTLFELPMPHDSTVSRLSFFLENQSHLHNSFALPWALLPGALCSLNWDFGTDIAERSFIYNQLQTQMVYLPLVRSVMQALATNVEPQDLLSRNALFALMSNSLYRDLNAATQVNDSYDSYQAQAMLDYIYPMVTTNIRHELLYFVPRYDWYSAATNNAIILDATYAATCSHSINNWENHWRDLSNYPESDYQKIKVDIAAATSLRQIYNALMHECEQDVTQMSEDDLYRATERQQNLIFTALEHAEHLDELTYLLWLDFQQKQLSDSSQPKSTTLFGRLGKSATPSPALTALSTQVPTDFRGGGAIAYTSVPVPSLIHSSTALQFQALDDGEEEAITTTMGTNITTEGTSTTNSAAVSSRISTATTDSNAASDAAKAAAAPANVPVYAPAAHSEARHGTGASAGSDSVEKSTDSSVSSSAGLSASSLSAAISSGADVLSRSSMLDQAYADYLGLMRYDFAFFKYFDRTRKEHNERQNSLYFGQVDFAKLLGQQPKFEQALAQEYLLLKQNYMTLQQSPLFSPQQVLQNYVQGTQGASGANGASAMASGAGAVNAAAVSGQSSKTTAKSDAEALTNATSLQELMHNHALNYKLFLDFLRICQLPAAYSNIEQQIDAATTLQQAYMQFLQSRDFLGEQQKRLDRFVQAHADNAFVQKLAPLGQRIMNFKQQAIAIACCDKVLSFYPQGTNATEVMGQLSRELAQEPFGLDSEHPLYTYEFEEILGTSLQLRHEYNPRPFLRYIEPLLYFDRWLAQHAADIEQARTGNGAAASGAHGTRAAVHGGAAASGSAGGSADGSVNGAGMGAANGGVASFGGAGQHRHQEGESEVCADVWFVYQHVKENPRLADLSKVFSSYAGAMINYYAQMADHVRPQFYAYSDFHQLAQNSRAYEINDRLHSLYDLSYGSIDGIDDHLLDKKGLQAKEQALKHLAQRLGEFSVELNDDCASTLTAWSLLPDDALSAGELIELSPELEHQLGAVNSKLPWWQHFVRNGRKLIQHEAVEQGTLTIESLMERLNAFPVAKDASPRRALDLEELNSLYAAFKFLGLKVEDHPLAALQGQAGRSSVGMDGLAGANRQIPSLVKSPSIKQQILKQSALSGSFLQNLEQILEVLCSRHQLGFELFVPSAAKQNQLYKNTKYNFPLAILTYRYVSASGEGALQQGAKISSAQNQNRKLYSGVVFEPAITLNFYEYSSDSKPQAHFVLHHYPALQMYLNPSTVYDAKAQEAYVPLTISSARGQYVFFVGLRFDQELPTPDSWPKRKDFR